jgi:hypothetical protein
VNFPDFAAWAGIIIEPEYGNSTYVLSPVSLDISNPDIVKVAYDWFASNRDGEQVTSFNDFAGGDIRCQWNQSFGPIIFHEESLQGSNFLLIGLRSDDLRGNLTLQIARFDPGVCGQIYISDIPNDGFIIASLPNGTGKPDSVFGDLSLANLSSICFYHPVAEDYNVTLDVNMTRPRGSPEFLRCDNFNCSENETIHPWYPFVRAGYPMSPYSFFRVGLGMEDDDFRYLEIRYSDPEPTTDPKIGKSHVHFPSVTEWETTNFETCARQDQTGYAEQCPNVAESDLPRRDEVNYGKLPTLSDEPPTVSETPPRPTASETPLRTPSCGFFATEAREGKRVTIPARRFRE